MSHSSEETLDPTRYPDHSVETTGAGAGPGNSKRVELGGLGITDVEQLLALEGGGSQTRFSYL